MPDSMLLLKQIADNTANHQLTWIVAAITGGTAILASIVAAWFAYFTAERTRTSQKDIEYKKLEANLVTEDAKLKATILTAERLRWLQDLRAKFSHLYANLDMQLSYLERPAPITQQGQLDALSVEVMSQVNAVLVMLNKEKPHQRELYAALNEAQVFMADVFARKRPHLSTTFDRQKHSALKQEAFTAIEAIGARAWAKVKNLQ